jgi:hypothetical protein
MHLLRFVLRRSQHLNSTVASNYRIIANNELERIQKEAVVVYPYTVSGPRLGPNTSLGHYCYCSAPSVSSALICSF